MKTYVVNSAEELETILSELAAPAKEPDIVFCRQDDKDLFAMTLEAYSEKFALVNRRFSEIFADMAERERTGH